MRSAPALKKDVATCLATPVDADEEEDLFGSFRVLRTRYWLENEAMRERYVRWIVRVRKRRV